MVTFLFILVQCYPAYRHVVR